MYDRDGHLYLIVTVNSALKNNYVPKFVHSKLLLLSQLMVIGGPAYDQN